MTEIKDGGPAFPAQFFDERATGMTLRDYFAAQALPEIIRDNMEIETDDFNIVLRMVSREAYMWADAMMKAREV